MKNILGSMVAAAFVVGFSVEAPTSLGSSSVAPLDMGDEAEPLSCLAGGQTCKSNRDCCTSMCWKGTCSSPTKRLP